jgi:hypothetical protein
MEENMDIAFFVIGWGSFGSLLVVVGMLVRDVILDRCWAPWVRKRE